MMLAITIGGSVDPIKEITIYESLSTTTSQIPMSHANWIPSSMALASISSGPKDTGKGGKIRYDLRTQHDMTRN